LRSLVLDEDDGPAAFAVVWALVLDYYSGGAASRAMVEAEWTKQFEWGNERNPDLSLFDPSKPATDAEKRRASGLLAIATKGGPLRS
jgi:hypothetical protein